MVKFRSIKNEIMLCVPSIFFRRRSDGAQNGGSTEHFSGKSNSDKSVQLGIALRQINRFNYIVRFTNDAIHCADGNLPSQPTTAHNAI